MPVPPCTTRLHVLDAAGRRRTLLFIQTIAGGVEAAKGATPAVVTTIRTEEGLLVRSLGANQYQVETTGEMLHSDDDTV
jgi:hypothetical protein